MISRLIAILSIAILPLVGCENRLVPLVHIDSEWTRSVLTNSKDTYYLLADSHIGPPIETTPGTGIAPIFYRVLDNPYDIVIDASSRALIARSNLAIGSYAVSVEVQDSVPFSDSVTANVRIEIIPPPQLVWQDGLELSAPQFISIESPVAGAPTRLSVSILYADELREAGIPIVYAIDPDVTSNEIRMYFSIDAEGMILLNGAPQEPRTYNIPIMVLVGSGVPPFSDRKTASIETR